MALALTRKPGERIIVGNPPFGTVEVVSIVGRQVLLAFNFPQNVTIRREEVPFKPRPPAADLQAQVDGHGLALADSFVLKYHEVGHVPEGWVECDRCGRIGASNHTHEHGDGRRCFRCWGTKK